MGFLGINDLIHGIMDSRSCDYPPVRSGPIQNQELETPLLQSRNSPNAFDITLRA